MHRLFDTLGKHCDDVQCVYKKKSEKSSNVPAGSLIISLMILEISTELSTVKLSSKVLATGLFNVTNIRTTDRLPTQPPKTLQPRPHHHHPFYIYPLDPEEEIAHRRPCYFWNLNSRSKGIVCLMPPSAWPVNYKIWGSQQDREYCSTWSQNTLGHQNCQNCQQFSAPFRSRFGPVSAPL